MDHNKPKSRPPRPSAVLGRHSVVTLGERRRLVLPAEVCEHLGISTGSLVHFVILDDGHIVLSSGEIQAEALASILKKSGTSAVADLIAERREEARRENDE